MYSSISFIKFCMSVSFAISKIPECLSIMKKLITKNYLCTQDTSGIKNEDPVTSPRIPI